MAEEKKWYVYILECMDESLYTGVTNDIDNRMKAHANGTGSKYVRRKGFKQLLRTKECIDKSDACKCEYQIKQLTRNEKLDWFRDNGGIIKVTLPTFASSFP
ncbi:GIY-YIG nuclease family protein [Candidatus Pacearchaeota archaeon]|nr:GIY-YIG nuclease family protein [Candidatus Pacearchaeota archaeon]